MSNPTEGNSTDHRFNYIYKELVKEPDDLVGLFAYSIYKQEKIEYILRFMEDHGDQRPTPQELQDFHRMSMGRCSQYRALAENKLNAVMQEIYANAVSELDSEYSKKLERKLHAFRPSFLNGAMQGAAGSVIFAVFIGFMVLFFVGVRKGISGLVSDAVKILTGQ